MSADRWAQGLAWGAGLLGMAHIGLTPLEYPQWSIAALWFLGSGLAMVTAAIANALGRSAAGRGNRLLLIGLNLAMAAFFAAAWTVLPAPQVIVGGLIFFGLAACAFARSSEPAVSGPRSPSP